MSKLLYYICNLKLQNSNSCKESMLNVWKGLKKLWGMELWAMSARLTALQDFCGGVHC